MSRANVAMMERLIEELKGFCTDTGVPHESADELLVRDGLTTWQRSYLMDFCRRWEIADGADIAAHGPRITFDEFRATGRDVDDIGEFSQIDEDEGKPGRVYLDNLYINREDGKWLLIICNQDWFGEPLEVMERHLYDYACSEGACDR